MTDLPATAITAAARAIQDHSIYADGEILARAALEAAAPHISTTNAAIDEAIAQAAAAERQCIGDLLEMAWVIIANAHEGNWDAGQPDWRGAAERWRDRYHEWLHEHVKTTPQGDTA